MCTKLPKVIQCKFNVKIRGLEKKLMGLKSLWEFFVFVGVDGGRGGVDLWVILLNMGYNTLYEKSCILETEN